MCLYRGVVIIQTRTDTIYLTLYIHSYRGRDVYLSVWCACRLCRYDVLFLDRQDAAEDRPDVARYAKVWFGLYSEISSI